MSKLDERLFDGIPFTGPEQRKFILRLFGTPGRTPKQFHATLGPKADLTTIEGIEYICKQINNAFDNIAAGRGAPGMPESCMESKPVSEHIADILARKSPQ